MMLQLVQAMLQFKNRWRLDDRPRHCRRLAKMWPAQEEAKKEK